MCCFFFFFFNDTATTEIYTLSLHDALPIWSAPEIDHPLVAWDPVPMPELVPPKEWVEIADPQALRPVIGPQRGARQRSEEHTSELQSPCNLVCRLLLEKKKKKSSIEHNIPA